MEPIILYFIKAGMLLILFLSAYYFFLRKETFFKSNRWFLLFGLVISVLLPVVTFKKTIWVEPAPIIENIAPYKLDSSPIVTADITGKTTRSEPEKNFEIDWFWIGLAIYAIGILALLIKFALDYFALKKVLKGKTIHSQEDYKFVNVKENIAPFSYFNFIVYNPALYNQVELENILEHEKVHCSQNHTVDVLIARLFCIAFWWNPFVWLYKKAIVQNLEFIADSDAFKNISDKKAYQFTLLKITTHDSCVAISNHFFQSLIKKRIVMLNKNQSNRWKSWKYAIIVPALALFMWQFQTKVVAQEKQASIIQNEPLSGMEMNITAVTTDEQLEEKVKLFKEKFGASLKFSKVKRNHKGEIISLKAVLKTKKSSESVYQVSGTNAIKSFKVFIDNDGEGYEDAGFGEANKTIAKSKNGNNNNDVAETRVEVVEVDDVGYASYYTNNDIMPPTPPMPPMPPAVPNYPTPPNAPNFPTPPVPPTSPPTESNKKAWKKFEEDSKKFEISMNSAEMKKWEKEIEEYSKKMDAMIPDNVAFDKEMQEFDKEMQAFDAEMKVFDKEMQEFNRKIQKEFRDGMLKEREEARKERQTAREIRLQERDKAKKESK